MGEIQFESKGLRVDTNTKMASSFYPRRMAFWNDYYPKLEEMKFDVAKEESGASVDVAIGTFTQVVVAILAIFFK